MTQPEMADQPTWALARFGTMIGLEGLSFDEDGNCTLRLGETLEVNIQNEPDFRRVTLSTTLGQVPHDRREAVYARLLEGNLFWSGTGGATLSLEPESRRVFLHERMPASELTAQSLETLLDRFVGAAEAWMAEMAEMMNGDGEPPTEPDDRKPTVWG